MWAEPTAIQLVAAATLHDERYQSFASVIPSAFGGRGFVGAGGK
jgi:hypothetical protein